MCIHISINTVFLYVSAYIYIRLNMSLHWFVSNSNQSSMDHYGLLPCLTSHSNSEKLDFQNSPSIYLLNPIYIDICYRMVNPYHTPMGNNCRWNYSAFVEFFLPLLKEFPFTSKLTYLLLPSFRETVYTFEIQVYCFVTVYIPF